LISGGGSGHEPAHAGYIGPGMLSAAVAGEIFTSPSAESVLAAIRAVTGRLGALLIVKNYTGDRLNFGLAGEMARAEGLLIETVIVADDVALAGSAEHAGKRGIAGTVLVHKIAGAAAAEEKDLPQVASIAQAAAENIGTMGVALSAGTSPVASGPAFTLDREVELGLGIHGEPGVRRIPIRPADELVEELLQKITSELRLRAGERIAVLINNLGATTAMEMAIVGRKTLSALQARGLEVDRLYAGPFVSSLDMAGISLSLLRVDDERLRWLDASTSAPAWPNVSRRAPGSILARIVEAAEEEAFIFERAPDTALGQAAERAIQAASDALINAEDTLSKMDQAVGDGDLGLNMTRAARDLQKSLRTYPLDHPPELLKRMGAELQGILGGSSGPLYGVLLLRTGSSLEAGSINDPNVWAAAVLDGCNAISELGGARLGDCTMLDALLPFARTFNEQLRGGSSWRESLSNGVRAAKHGAEKTARMIARRGRSSYLGERTIGFADPGATAVAIWLDAIMREIVR
ncbi:MAG: dihydroxyacetone kinase subunit L, partial [Acidobacteriaceae bacterium]|nr:dihydroxyacetone kinase subunit L [Acidobacteriaceae bacterium]